VMTNGGRGAVGAGDVGRGDRPLRCRDQSVEVGGGGHSGGPRADQNAVRDAVVVGDRVVERGGVYGESVERGVGRKVVGFFIAAYKPCLERRRRVEGGGRVG